MDHSRWTLRGSEDRPTHLLLDGGKLLVPDRDAGDFLNWYANKVVQGAPLAVVELRTPVFRMLFDLDIKHPVALEPPFHDIAALAQRVVSEFFEMPDVPDGPRDAPRLVVLTTPPKTLPDGVVKAGRHLVWSNVFVTQPTALAVRDAFVAALDEGFPGACTEPWDTVVDKCVLVRNGLRMPWSTKGRAGSSVYTPAHVFDGDGPTDVDPVRGVTAVRTWLRDTSVRCWEPETPLRPGVHVHEDIQELSNPGIAGTRCRLAEYGHVVDALLKALPEPYHDCKITGIIQTETCFILKSSSRYCMNVGRCHNSSSTFFVLSARGVRCGCFSRKDRQDLDVRPSRFCRCVDFRSDHYEVPMDVLQAFFGENSAIARDFTPMPMSSHPRDLPTEELLQKARPLLHGHKRTRKK